MHIPNSVDLETMTVEAVAGDPGDPFVYLGRLVPEKGVATLIRAAAQARVRLRIIGTGPEEAALRQLAAELGGEVEFTGYLAGPALLAAVSSARAVVVPSEWYENAPISVMEASALGRVVIGADIGGIPELIRSGETGFVFTSGSVDSLVEVLTRVRGFAASSLRQIGAGRTGVDADGVQPRGISQPHDGFVWSNRHARWRCALDLHLRTGSEVQMDKNRRARVSVIALGLRGMPNVPGGVEVHASELYPRLQALGADVTVMGRIAYRPANSPPQWRGVRVRWTSCPRGTGIEALVHTFFGVLYAAVRRPDVLHIHAVGPWLMVPLAKMLGLKVVVTHHGQDYLREKWNAPAKAILRLGEKLGMRFADERIVISSALHELARDKYRRAASLIPNGVSEPAQLRPRGSWRNTVSRRGGMSFRSAASSPRSASSI